MPTTHATYVYCLAAAVRRPSVGRARSAVPGAGSVRLIALDDSLAHNARGARLKRWLVVADVPVAEYNEAAIRRHLNDLDWVSRAAMAHEQVVESFAAASALLPMKLFTIFSSDERAVADLRARAGEVGALLRHVMNHDEWGVRIMLGRPAGRPRASRKAAVRKVSGVDYLARKKAQRDETAERVVRSRDVTAGVYERLSSQASRHKRRVAAEAPAAGGQLLLDGAFLVARSKAARFRSAVRREAQSLARDGYQLTLTGPWPAYSFMRD